MRDDNAELLDDHAALLALASHHTLMQLAHWATALDVMFGDMSLRDVVGACQDEMMRRAAERAVFAPDAMEIRH
jgi:hypothetical protein